MQIEVIIAKMILFCLELIARVSFAGFWPAVSWPLGDLILAAVLHVMTVHRDRGPNAIINHYMRRLADPWVCVKTSWPPLVCSTNWLQLC